MRKRHLMQHGLWNGDGSSPGFWRQAKNWLGTRRGPMPPLNIDNEWRRVVATVPVRRKDK